MTTLPHSPMTSLPHPPMAGPTLTLAEQTQADRRSYLDAGLRTLACAGCPAVVRVKKNSELHTSVQWTVQAVRQCAEFATRDTGGQPSALVATCGRLRESVEQAVREGRLDVPTTRS